MSSLEKGRHSSLLANFKPIHLWLFLGVFPVIGIIFGINQLMLANESNSWSTTAGRIMESYVYSSASRSTHGIAHVRYEYMVGDDIFIGDRLSYSPSNNHDYANSGVLQAVFPKGANVTVYFDPTSPSDSVLLPGYRLKRVEFSTMISCDFILLMLVLAGWLTRTKASS